MKEAIRILIADDHAIVRDGLRLILETNPDFELVGEAADGASAVRLAGGLQPNVVLMDLRMPGMDGLEAIERLCAQVPNSAVVILTTYNEDDLMLRGLRAGARGYLLKDTNRDALFNALYSAARGETLLQPEILARVLAHTSPAPAPSKARGAVELSEREREVLAGAARGERNKEIAARLGITERTVKAHLASIFAKLNVDSRASAVAVAIQAGSLVSNPFESDSS
jgi:NarL family two-component system response regulator YdfI